MYEQVYKFHTAPFENTADPRFFFASEQHREALAAIEYTVRMRKGFVLITGDIGTGKSTVGRTMCQRCAGQATLVPVLHGHQDRVSMLRQILRHLGQESALAEDASRLLERLREQFIELLDRGRPVVLLIDEAQTLSDEALEELRLLSQLDTATRKTVQAVLVGQNELRLRIREPRHTPLRQRIAMAKQLTPLSLEETAAYISHRIGIASIDPQKPGVAFANEAVAKIHKYTGGVPRLINVACDNCLLLGFVDETRKITAAMVRRVMQDMVPSFDEPVLTAEITVNRVPEGV